MSWKWQARASKKFQRHEPREKNGLASRPIAEIQSSPMSSNLIRPLLSVLLLVLTVLGLYNVYGDNASVVKLAEQTACEDCERNLVQATRSPLAQTFSFQIDKTTTVVAVNCQRSLYLVGDYACEVTAR